MADSTLLKALLGNEYSYTPKESLSGALASGIGGSLPALVNPYGSTGSNLAAVLGGSLLAGLFGYSAKREAEQKNAEMMPVMMDILSAKEPTKIAEILKTSPYGQRLSPLGISRLSALEEAQAQTLGDELKFKRELDLIEAKERAKAKYRAPKEGKEKKDWFQGLPTNLQTRFVQVKGVSDELKQLRDDFESMKMYGIDFAAQSKIPGSKAELLASRMKTLLPNVVRTMGEVGNLAQQEQQRVLDSTLGSMFSGTESTSKRLNNLLNQFENISKTAATNFKQAYEKGGDILLESRPSETISTAPVTGQNLNIQALMNKYPGVTITEVTK